MKKHLLISYFILFFTLPSIAQNTPTVMEAQEWVLSKLRKYPKTSESVEDVGNLVFMTKSVTASDFKFTDDGKLTMIEHFKFGGTDKIFDNSRDELVEIDIKFFKNVEIDEDQNLLVIVLYGDNAVSTIIKSSTSVDSKYRVSRYSIFTVSMDITSEPDLHLRMEKALNDIKKHYAASDQKNEKY